MLYLLKNSGSGPTLSVLVAKGPITAGTPLSTDNVTSVDLPAASVPDDAFTDPSQVVGKSLVNNVRANTPIVPALIVQPGQSGPPGTASSGKLDITSGYVAIAIPTGFTFTNPPATIPLAYTGGAADLVTAGFYVTAGDHIDILVGSTPAANPTVKYAFQDVRILKVGDNGAAAAGGAPVLVVELPRTQAELLTFLINVQCNPSNVAPNCHQPSVLKYVLRPICDYGDPNYESNVKNITSHTPADVAKLTGKDKETADKLLKCVHPYPNYLPITNPTAGFPNTPPAITDPGVTPGTLQALFGLA